MAETQKNERYRMVLLGDEGVGKTALLVRFLCRRFLGEYDPNIEDAYAKKVTVDGQTLILEILDTAVKEQGTSRRHKYMKSANAFIFVYSTNNMESFRSIMKFKSMTDMYTTQGKNLSFGLVGTKNDLSHLRQVTRLEGERLANSFGWAFCECSSSANDNVDRIFHNLTRRLHYPRPDSKPGLKTITERKVSLTRESRSFLTRLTEHIGRKSVFMRNFRSHSDDTAIRNRSKTNQGSFFPSSYSKDRRRSYSMTTLL